MKKLWLFLPMIVLVSACSGKTAYDGSLGVQSAPDNESNAEESAGENLSASLKLSAELKDFRDPLGNFTLKYPAGLSFKSVEDKRKVQFVLEEGDKGIVLETVAEDMETVDEELGERLEYIARKQVTYDSHVGVRYTEASNALEVLIIPVDESQTLKITADGSEYLEIFEVMVGSLDWINS